MKFKAGDLFYVIENGLVGEIVGISYNSINQCDEYVVKWRHQLGSETYPVDECDSIWEHRSFPSTPKCVIGHVLTTNEVGDLTWKNPAPALHHIPITITFDNIKVQCNGHHTWKVYDSGFRRFEYCQHCNEERHEN